MTNKDILKLAEKGYATKHISPQQCDSDCCVLVAAVLGKTGHYKRDFLAGFCSLLHRSTAWVEGVIVGFDTNNGDCLPPNYASNQRLRARFINGFKFGRKAAKKFLPNGR